MALKLKNNVAKICDATFKVFLSKIWKVSFSAVVILWNLPSYFLHVLPSPVQCLPVFPGEVNAKFYEFRIQFFLASQPNTGGHFFVRIVIQHLNQWKNGLFASFNFRSHCLFFAKPPTKQLNAETEYATNN